MLLLRLKGKQSCPEHKGIFVCVCVYVFTGVFPHACVYVPCIYVQCCIDDDELTQTRCSHSVCVCSSVLSTDKVPHFSRLGDVEVNAGQNATFQCVATGKTGEEEPFLLEVSEIGRGKEYEDDI